MEGVPRVPMISFPLRRSADTPNFKSALRNFISNHYNEEPDSYATEIHDLESLRASAVHAPKDYSGCSTLKKYCCQLYFLKSRFPMNDGGSCAIGFSWYDVFGDTVIGWSDVDFEISCVLYNIGALHTELGALDNRVNVDGMKTSCTHFQCAAWAFSHIRHNFQKFFTTQDISADFLTILTNICLAQAQECILEKSLIDNRKSTITAKVALQIVEYYTIALRLIDGILKDSVQFSDKLIKSVKKWRKLVEIKIQYYGCIAYYCRGVQAEDQGKWGERVTMYKGGAEKLTECLKLAKNLEKADPMHDTLQFTQDLVVGKVAVAEKENEFIYHEKCPDLESVTSDVKGVSLVKGIPFKFDDPQVAGPDIFGRLVPMEAHEASSLYSEEKAKILRTYSRKIEEKNEILERFLLPLQLDQLEIHDQDSNEKLPQELVDCCANLSVKPDAVEKLSGLIGKLSNISSDVEADLEEIQYHLSDQEKREAEYQKIVGLQHKVPSNIISDLTKEFEKFRGAHEHAQDSNKTLKEAILPHLENLKILLEPLDDLAAKHIPSYDQLEKNEESLNRMQKLKGKVEEMKGQRVTLEDQLRDSILSDDITKILVVKSDDDMEKLFQEEIQKHDGITQILDQNLLAQENIMRALTEANAEYAETRKSLVDIMRQRDSVVQSLLSSYNAYDELCSKCNDGLEFYTKLGANVQKLLQRVRSVAKVQNEERDGNLERIIRKGQPPPPIPSISGGVTQNSIFPIPQHHHNPAGPLPILVSPQLQPQMSSPTPQAPEPAPPVKQHLKLKDFLAMKKAGISTSDIAARNSGVPPTEMNQAAFNLQNQHSAISQSPNHTPPPGHGQPGQIIQDMGVRPAPIGSEDISKDPNIHNNFNYNYNYAAPEKNPDNSALVYPPPNPAMQSNQYYPAHQQPTQNVFMPGPTPNQQNNVAVIPPQNFANNFANYQQPQPVQQQQQPNMNYYPTTPTQMPLAPPMSQIMPFPSASAVPTQVVAPQPQPQVQAPPQQFLPPSNQPAQPQPPQFAPPQPQVQAPPTQFMPPQNHPVPAPQVMPSPPPSAPPQVFQAPTQIMSTAAPIPIPSSSPIAPSAPTQILQHQHQPPHQIYAPHSPLQPPFSNVSSPIQYFPSHVNYNASTQINTPSYANFHTPSSPANPLAYTVTHSRSNPCNYGGTISYTSPNSAYSTAAKTTTTISFYSPAFQPMANTATNATYSTRTITTPTAGTGAAADPQTQSQPQTQNQPQPQNNQEPQNYTVNVTVTSSMPNEEPSSYIQSSFLAQYVRQNQGYVCPTTHPISSNNQENTSISSFAVNSFGYPQQIQSQTSEVAKPLSIQLQPQPQQAPTSSSWATPQLQALAHPTVHQHQHQAPPQPQQNQAPPPLPTQPSPAQPQPAAVNVAKPQPQPQPPRSSNMDLLSDLDFSAAKVTEPMKTLTETKMVPITTSVQAITQLPISSISTSMQLPKNIPKPIPKPKADPFDDPAGLEKFKADVDSFREFVETLGNKIPNEPTYSRLDKKWWKLQDIQTKGRKSISVARCYPMKNRFPDILPYDQTRVPVCDSDEDYINASFLENLNGTEFSPCYKLIATQAPLPGTISDFWQMIWHHHVEHVVCLCSDNDLKGHVYWPQKKGDKGRLEHGALKIVLQTTTEKSGYVERILLITHQDLKQSRAMVHLQFLGWTGQSQTFPVSPGPLVQFVREVAEYHGHQRIPRLPIVVHCIPGVGKTGVFAVLAAAIQEIDGGAIPDVLGIAGRASEQRKGIMNDKEYLRFSYQALLYYCQEILAKRGISSTSLADFAGSNPNMETEHEKPKVVKTAMTSHSSTSASKSKVMHSCFEDVPQHLTNIDPVTFHAKSRLNVDFDGSTSVKKQKKNDFDSSKRSLFETSASNSSLAKDNNSKDENKDDPLSSLDPLWSLKK